MDTAREDLACGLGKELRLYGVDLSQGLIDAGFDLFMNRKGKEGR